MANQNQLLIDLRPIIDLEFNGEKSPEEVFMHNTLRPILKFQHDKIIQLIKSTPHFENIQFISNSNENTRVLKQFIVNNSNLKIQLNGIIIGLMTTEEFNFYLTASNSIGKRIIEMAVVRYLSTN